MMAAGASYAVITKTCAHIFYIAMAIAALLCAFRTFAPEFAAFINRIVAVDFGKYVSG